MADDLVGIDRPSTPLEIWESVYTKVLAVHVAMTMMGDEESELLEMATADTSSFTSIVLFSSQPGYKPMSFEYSPFRTEASV